MYVYVYVLVPSQVNGLGLSVINAVEGLKTLPQLSVIVGIVNVSVASSKQATVEDAPGTFITRGDEFIVIVCS